MDTEVFRDCVTIITYQSLSQISNMWVRYEFKIYRAVVVILFMPAGFLHDVL